MKHTVFALLTAAFAMSACTQTVGSGKNAGLMLGLVGKPADTTTEIAQIQRFRGQTAFFNVQDNMRGMPGREMPAPNAPGGAAPGGAPRDQQESDVFKVGLPGSKILYLMNQYRGLQVVSFAKGEEQPELLGRAATTGSSVDEMYSDLKNNRLISIEHDYKYEDGQDQSHSMLVIYDVSKATSPVRSRVVDVDGLVMDSRIVGDVLYVASREDTKGLVTSYSLTSPDLHQVEQHELTMPVAYGENMNIIQQDDKYYLVAVLADKGWGWWQNASVVDVVDISDAHGKIKPLMSVATRGFIRERSQTAIKNNTLIVTSNYAPKEAAPGRQQIFRIAVETFKFPVETSEVLSDDEATFRKLNIQRQLVGHSGTDLDQLQDKLMNDPLLGLKGRFIRVGETIKKIVSDSMVTVGDGSGLSAQLQDVRYQDGLLYAFWVPRDQIDPFDMFDMSHPENGIAYLGRLHFDGWIERAIPFSFANRKFVLGLGWILPVVDNDDGRRVPQAMIFEVKQVGTSMKAVDVAQLSLEGSQIYTEFNGQDKMVEVRETTPGQGEILFGAERFGRGQSEGGGQIVRFDLSKVDAGAALSAGPFLSGGADWIRRVFTNPEINRINSFSDHALATFSDSQLPGDMHPVSILELARDIAGFETLQGVGIQIVTDGYWGSVGSTTSLRAVKAVDAEKAQALSTLELPGTYESRLIIGNDLLVLTSKYDSKQTPNGGYTSTTTERLTRVTSSAAGVLSEVAHVEFVYSGYPNGINFESSIVRLADGTLLASIGGIARKLDISKGLASADLATDASCTTTNRESLELKVMNGAPYMLSTQSIASKDYEGEQLIRHYLSPISVGATSIACQATYNIPGDIQSVNANGDILVVDTWTTDIRKDKDVFRKESQTSLFSLHLENGLATLKDESVLPAAQSGPFFPRMMMPRCPGCYSSRPDFHVIGSQLFSVNASGDSGTLEMYQAGADSMIEKETRSFDASLDDDSVSVSFVEGAVGEHLAVLKGSEKMKVIRWTSTDLRPEVLSVKLVDERNQAGDATDEVRVPGYWWSSGDLHYSPATRSIEMARGWSGLTQILLAK